MLRTLWLFCCSVSAFDITAVWLLPPMAARYISLDRVPTHTSSLTVTPRLTCIALYYKLLRLLGTRVTPILLSVCHHVNILVLLLTWCFSEPEINKQIV